MTGDSIAFLTCCVVSVFAFGVVEHFDVVEHVLPSFISGFAGFAPDALTLQELEAVFSDGYRRSFASRLVVTVAPAAHGVFEIVLLQE